MKLPDFLESSHPLISPLLDWGDEQLLEAFQQNPHEGRYFIAIFCRYGALTFSLLTNKARSPMQVDYLFARVWRNLFFELRALTTDEMHGENSTNQGLQAWIFTKTAMSIHTEEIPSIEDIPYSLETTPLPFWCYTQFALDFLPPLERLVLVLDKTFHWSEVKIRSFLMAEGESLEPEDLEQHLQAASDRLEASLPEDIREIYLVE